MGETRVRSFAQLHRALRRYQRSNLWLFRGQSDVDWRLIPKAGRPPFSGYDDRRLFASWSRRSVEFLAAEPGDAWNALAIAQHHGLATRLLDWSYNPLVAAFFAVWEDSNADGVIYAYLSARRVVPERGSPFSFEGVRRFKPKGIAARITRQSGILTVHGPPTVALDDALGPDDVLEKIVIDRSYRPQLLFDLSFYGINRLTLFPDLDGLAAYSNWVAANRQFWSGVFEEAREH